jgi:NAD(P)H-dependent FMN reductase
MRLTIVSGSHRVASQSGKVARVAQATAVNHVQQFDRVRVLDLAQIPLSLWEESEAIARTASRSDAWNDVSSELTESDAFVFVIPEWSGMAPPAFKNFLLMCDAHELAHKPALLIGISSGMGGAYPLAELRANSAKDTKVCYMPENIIIRRVEEMLNGPEPLHESDGVVLQRLLYLLRVLVEYARALASVRSSGVVDNVRYPYGM